jgi:hypothetical protein
VIVIGGHRLSPSPLCPRLTIGPQAQHEPDLMRERRQDDTRRRRGPYARVTPG